MENANQNMFAEINAVCDKYNAPHLGTQAFNELCELLNSGKLEQGTEENLVSVEIAKIPKSGLQKFIETTGLSVSKLNQAYLFGRGIVNIKESQANILGLI